MLVVCNKIILKGGGNMIPWIIWAVLLIVFVVIEAATAQLVTIWFAVGALVTVFVAYFCPTLWWLQLLVFAAVSVVALIATRPLVKKFAKKNTSQWLRWRRNLASPP